MTMVFSAGTDKFLVMANDSAIERVGFPEGPEYDTDAKAFCCDGVGVVTMWGARDGNQLIRHLRDLHDKSPLRTIDHLAQEVFRYLTKEYQPHEREGGCVDTGYHVGGFTDSGQVRLYQIAWNRPGSGVARSNQGAYVMELHHPNQEMRALYNGRSDIVGSADYSPDHRDHDGERASISDSNTVGYVSLCAFRLARRLGADQTSRRTAPRSRSLSV